MVTSEDQKTSQQEIQTQTARMCQLIKELATNSEPVKTPGSASDQTVEQLYDMLNQNIDAFAALLQDQAQLSEIQTAYNSLKHTLEAFKAAVQKLDKPEYKPSIELIDNLLQGQSRAVEFCCVGLPEYDEIIKQFDIQEVEAND